MTELERLTFVLLRRPPDPPDEALRGFCGRLLVVDAPKGAISFAR
jgi:hypothetical protein